MNLKYEQYDIKKRSIKERKRGNEQFNNKKRKEGRESKKEQKSPHQ